jgi:hypothetical protein
LGAYEFFFLPKVRGELSKALDTFLLRVIGLACIDLTFCKKFLLYSFTFNLSKTLASLVFDLTMSGNPSSIEVITFIDRVGEGDVWPNFGESSSLKLSWVEYKSWMLTSFIRSFLLIVDFSTLGLAS